MTLFLDNNKSCVYNNVKTLQETVNKSEMNKNWLQFLTNLIKFWHFFHLPSSIVSSGTITFVFLCFQGNSDLNIATTCLLRHNFQKKFLFIQFYRNKWPEMRLWDESQLTTSCNQSLVLFLSHNWVVTWAVLHNLTSVKIKIWRKWGCLRLFQIIVTVCLR